MLHTIVGVSNLLTHPMHTCAAVQVRMRSGRDPRFFLYLLDILGVLRNVHKLRCICQP